MVDNFWRLGEKTYGPSQLELVYLTPLPNALYKLTEFRENSSKSTGVMGCTIMRLWTDSRWMDRRMDSMLTAISPEPISLGIKKFNKRSR